MYKPTRRETLALGAGSLIASLIGPHGAAQAAIGNTLTIAFNVNLPAFDPTVGPSAVNPTTISMFFSGFHAPGCACAVHTQPSAPDTTAIAASERTPARHADNR